MVLTLYVKSTPPYEFAYKNEENLPHGFGDKPLATAWQHAESELHKCSVAVMIQTMISFSYEGVRKGVYTLDYFEKLTI